MDDLRVDLIDKARIMATNRTVNHPWSKMTDLEMLRSASLYEKNLQTGEEGFNLADICFSLGDIYCGLKEGECRNCMIPIAI